MMFPFRYCMSTCGIYVIYFFEIFSKIYVFRCGFITIIPLKVESDQIINKIKRYFLRN
jgi:hypothetical protein